MITDPTALHAVAVLLSKQGMTINQLGALTTLATQGPLTSTRIARVFGLSTAALVKIMDHLTDRGLITRLPHANRRERLSAITAAGRQLLSSIITPTSHEEKPPASASPSLTTICPMQDA